MARLSEEEIDYLKYQIYSRRYDDPWITNEKTAKLLHRSASTVERYAKKAEEKEVIWAPKPRLRCSPQRRIALLLFENKYQIFDEYQNYPGLDYICVFQGDWNIMATYDEPLDFSQFPGYIRTVVDTEPPKVHLFRSEVHRNVLSNSTFLYFP